MDNCYILLCLHFRWRIEPDEFERNYTPLSAPKATYLLYEVHWGRSHKTWKYSCQNDDDHHAEINFFENYCEKIKSRTDKPCSVTWFLSWSPCHECSQYIIKFLEKYTHVTLDIRVSRLFRDSEEQNKTGLRDLVGHGIPISIMHPGGKLICLYYVDIYKTNAKIMSLVIGVPSKNNSLLYIAPTSNSR